MTFEKSKNARQRKNLKSCQFFITLWKRTTREVQSTGRSHEQYDTFQSEWINTRRRKGKNFSSITERFRKDEILPKFSARHRMDRRTLSTFGLAHDNWFLMHSYAERASATWRLVSSGSQWSRTEAWINERKGNITCKRCTKFWFCEDKWGIQINISLNIYDSESDQLKNVKGWNCRWNVGMEQLVSILSLSLLFNLVDATRMARTARKI